MKSNRSSSPEPLRLLICRHAKSSWRDASLSDFDRPLNKRGERDAPEMGRRLAQRSIAPDLIMTSPAVRALATASHYARQLGFPSEQIQRNPLQYSASVATLVGEVRKVDPRVTTLLLVGHNPESTALANALGRLQIDNLPTGGIVALTFPGICWAEMAAGLGTLWFFDFPKMQGE